mmetsp:Transcript_112551/g.223724  ORF Transcript_112551/g.223724 Transcript_112551/m.223724 type:complete len:205 (-) Transcript_112551:1178-1792(-)
MASWTAARSWLRIVENSSMQQTPPSASTRAPASSTKSGPSRTAAQVRPALVHPRPLVRTALLLSSWAACKSCDFPVPGSPSRSKCGVVRPRAVGSACISASTGWFGLGAAVGRSCFADEESEDTNRFQRNSESPPDPCFPAAGATGDPPISVSSNASLGTGKPLSHGAVDLTIWARICHSSARFAAQSRSNSSLLVGFALPCAE